MFKKLKREGSLIPKPVRAYFWGLFAIASIILVGSFLLTLILNNTNFLDKYVGIVQVVINIVALFFGGIMTAHIIGKKGLLNGAALGVIYIILMLVLAKIQGNPIDLYVLLIKAAYSIVASAIGGLCGVRMVQNIKD